MKFFFIFALAFSLAVLVGSRSKTVRIIASKGVFNVLAILLLGVSVKNQFVDGYTFAVGLLLFGVIFSFVWLLLKNEGFKDRGKL